MENKISTLQVRGLRKVYGKRAVVSDISFEMRSGQVVGLLGPNGAGKTTTFFMIVGFVRSDGGSIILDGKDISGLAMYQRAKKGLSYLPQEPSVFRKLSVQDNIRLVIQSRNDLDSKQKKELLEDLIVSFGLEKVRLQKGYTLSGGERRRCEIARCLAMDPSFLLLDEPFAGIDPKAIYEIKQIIRDLSERGIGVLITDHNVRDTLNVTDCAYIISEGRILVSGSREDLISNPIARDVYFGDSFEDK